MNSFTFNGRSSAEMGLIIEDKEIYSLPARDINLVSVPGRNGDVIVDNNRWLNITVSYTVGIKNIGANIKQIKAWLSTPGYFELSDTYNTDYYRIACFNSSLDVTELLTNVGRAVISFSCKPFMYSVRGKSSWQYTTTHVMANPEYFDSLPFIRAYGNGNITFHINDKAFTINNVSSYVDIDSELMVVYRGNEIKNKDALFTEFPILVPGNNTITPGANCTNVTISPRWRTL